MSVRSDQVLPCVISPNSKEFLYITQSLALAFKFLLGQELYNIRILASAEGNFCIS